MPLDYSPKTALRWHQRKRSRRALLATATVCFLGGAWLVLPAALGRADLAWKTSRNRALVRACMTYAAPADQVVFDLDAGAVNALVPAPPWVRWMPAFGRYPTPFLHARRDPLPAGGPAEQLVAVQVETHLRGTYDGRTILDRPLLCFEPYEFGAVGPTVHVSQSSGCTKLVILPGPRDRVRVFAGRPDPADAAAFSFDVEYNGVRQTVRGRLAGGLITLTPAAGTTFAHAGWRHAVFWSPAGATAATVDAALSVVGSAGQPSPTTWPPTPFGQPFNAPTSAPTTPGERSGKTSR